MRRWNLSTRPFAWGCYAVVWCNLVPRSMERSDHRADMNWEPRSEEMSEGRPKCWIHPPKNATAMSIVDVALSGMATGQWVALSNAVRRWVYPLEAGRGPTKSMWTWSKRLIGSSKLETGEWTWRWTFARWHVMHSFAHSPTCLLMPCQTYRSLTRRLVARAPGWLRECRASKTSRRKGVGTSGRGRPPETSHSSITPFSPAGTSARRRPLTAVRQADISSALSL
jgi:hypothetical protein